MPFGNVSKYSEEELLMVLVVWETLSQTEERYSLVILERISHGELRRVHC